MESVQPVNHEFMEEFLMDLARTIRGSSNAQITVGQVSPGWPRAWNRLELDFYQWHLYSWMEQKDIYRTKAPYAELCAPVVLGEIPMAPLDSHTVLNTVEESRGIQPEGFSRMIAEMRMNGWAGAWIWSYQGRVPAGARLPEFETETVKNQEVFLLDLLQ
ncbi:MAG: hypothetical protein RH862_19410 [Leptospiraceae bacterium]